MLDRMKIEKLRALPIEAVAERLGLRVTRHKCLCPFHDDHHASMTFLARTNSFRCFACGAHGGTIDVVMRHRDKDFRRAWRWLADDANVVMDEYRTGTPVAEKAMRPFDASRYARNFEHPWLSSEAQLEALRVSLGKSREGTRGQLHVWKNRNFITYSAQTGLYSKTQEYLTGNVAGRGTKRK